MKLKEIQIGGRYQAKVSGQLKTVRIVRIYDHWQAAPSRYNASGVAGRTTTRIEAIVESTGRTIMIRSPQRLRALPAAECEFCRKRFNRPDAGPFTCPYCQKVWEG